MSLLRLRIELSRRLGHFKVYKRLQRSAVAKRIDIALISLKKNITGRACGDNGDGLSQYLSVAQYVRQTRTKNVATLEIGTLFGASCLTQLFAIRNLRCSGDATCVDPMTGYYGEECDPGSKIPVNPETFYANIKKFDFSESNVNLITEMSTSPNVFESLKNGEGSYATLIIDGDHSYQGVRFDWENYHRYVAKGGFVLFDDYHEVGHPDVTKFVDQLIESEPPDWKVCGTIGTTIILQRLAK
jgi:hypothetical protein